MRPDFVEQREIKCSLILNRLRWVGVYNTQDLLSYVLFLHLFRLDLVSYEFGSVEASVFCSRGLFGYTVHRLPDVHMYVQVGWCIIVNIPFLTFILIAKQFILELGINSARGLFTMINFNAEFTFKQSIWQKQQVNLKQKEAPRCYMRLIAVNAF